MVNPILNDITVDDFTYKTKYRFLSHAHADHTKGLHKSYAYPIITSRTTKQHIITKFNISPYTILSFPLNEWVIFDQDIRFVLLDANHSYGAVMFYIEYKNNKILHTGDFRYSPTIHTHNIFNSLKIPFRNLDFLYLDTTYLHKRFNHPPQASILNDLITAVNKHKTEKSIILIGSYTIGKEKVFQKVIDTFSLDKVYCVDRAKPFLSLYFKESQKDNKVEVINNKQYADLHIVDLRDIKIGQLKYYKKHINKEIDTVIGVVPVGFTIKMKVENHIDKGVKYVIIKCPYSEHSSYDELRSFCRIVKANKIIPTVNYNSLSKNNELNKRLFKSGFQQKLDGFIVKKKKNE